MSWVLKAEAEDRKGHGWSSEETPGCLPFPSFIKYLNTYSIPRRVHVFVDNGKHIFAPQNIRSEEEEQATSVVVGPKGRAGLLAWVQEELTRYGKGGCSWQR